MTHPSPVAGIDLRNPRWVDDPWWNAVLVGGVRIALVVLGALLLRWLLNRAIDETVEAASQRTERRRAAVEPEHSDARAAKEAADAAERRHQRTRTMASLLRSIVSVTVFAVVILIVLTELGVSIAPLLASAGIGGIALGFGAQSLVKDFLSGVFMIVEDQYGVGDVIDAGEATGEVEEITLRVTRLRDANGVVWYIRNGEIVRIGNKSQGWSMATIDVPVAYDEDPTRLGELVKTVAADLFADPTWGARLIEEPTFAGVESISGGTMTVRCFAKCKPGEQFGVSREVRERIAVAFNSAGVRGPQLTFGGGSQS